MHILPTVVYLGVYRIVIPLLPKLAQHRESCGLSGANVELDLNGNETVAKKTGGFVHLHFT